MTTDAPTAVLLSRDLMLQAMLAGAAQPRGWQLVTRGTWHELSDLLSQQTVRLVLYDLSMAGELPEPHWWRDLHARGIATVAFGPHVHLQRLQAARQAGCQQVLSRGQLHQQAGTLFPADPE
jgi:hypothetical protein